MKIAITGTIGSGKSTVCDYLRQKGFVVFSCDEYNKYLLEKGNKGCLLVKEVFPEVFIEDELNKAKLADIVFKDKIAKEKLESILHPLILEEMLKEANKNKIFFAEVPLLFETGQQKYFDYSFLCTVDENIAINRLINRGLSEIDGKRRIESQMSVTLKEKLADEIIYNNSDLNELYRNVDKLLDKYVR